MAEEGWAVVAESPLAHYFIEGRYGECGQLRSLCRGAEQHAIAAMLPLDKVAGPVCHHCLRQVEYRTMHGITMKDGWTHIRTS